MRPICVHGLYTAVYTVVYTAVYTARTLPCLWPCSRPVHGRDGRVRPCTGRLHLYTLTRSVYTAQPCTRLCTGHVLVYTSLHLYTIRTPPCNRITVDSRVHGLIAVYSALFTARTRPFNGRVRVLYTCTRPRSWPCMGRRYAVRSRS